MIKNYFKIALRNFIKERFYGFINVFGLSIGIAASLVVLLYVAHELSYDTSHPDSDRLFRVNQTLLFVPQGGVSDLTSLPLADLLREEFPEVESSLRIVVSANKIVRNADDQFQRSYFENDILTVDSNFFEFFDFRLEAGDAATALKGVNKVVISQEMAYKYFGDKPALGKTLLFGPNKEPMEITGITTAQPTNVHFDFDFLLSINSNPDTKRFERNWTWWNVVTYVKLLPGADPQLLDQKLEGIGERIVKPALVAQGQDYDDMVADKGGWNFYLQPAKDIYLKSSEIGNRIGPLGDIKLVYIFTAIAVLIVVLAAINFVNLSTARATVRAKEIGVRKVMGSLKKQILGQFLMESIILCSIATIMGLGLMEILKLVIHDLVGFPVHLSLWDDPLLLAMALPLPLIFGVLSGLYPA